MGNRIFPQRRSNDHFHLDRSQTKRTEEESKEDVTTSDCVICCERLGSSYRTLEHCKHHFHHPCIDQWFESSGKQSCPTCGYVYGISKGPQPPHGRMLINYLPKPLPGFEDGHYSSGQGATIEISYNIPSGIQGPLNPQPGHPYGGTSRKAYLPNTKEGREILHLLKRAFEDQHVFTIGRSSTTGQDNVVTWNDIHHKTSPYGGPERYVNQRTSLEEYFPFCLNSFGYPDPTYLFRVRQELADKGYK